MVKACLKEYISMKKAAVSIRIWRLSFCNKKAIVFGLLLHSPFAEYRNRKYQETLRWCF